MKIAIDISPLSSGHKVRGVGFYLEHLKKALLKYFPQHEYIFFTQQNEVPEDLDVLHYPYFDPFFLTLPFARKHKTVVTVHDLTPLVFPREFPVGIKGTLKWRLQRLSLKNVDGILADSFASKKDIERLAGIQPKKIDVAYLAAGEEFRQIQDLIFKKQVIEKYGLPEKFALYVGDVTPNKNLPRIVEACLKETIPLVMVGKALAQESFDRKNPWNKDLVTVKKLIKNEKNIFVLGFVTSEELVALYNSATVCVMPSLYEGFGLPIVEAMACGCPVIASHGGSLKEVAGNSAFIVNPENIESIAGGLRTVFDSEIRQRELREKGLVVAGSFSWEKTAQETLKMYEKVTDKNRNIL